MSSPYVVVKWKREGEQKQLQTRFPVDDVEKAKEALLKQFPGAQIVGSRVVGLTAASEKVEEKPLSTAELAKTPVAPHLQHLSSSASPPKPAPVAVPDLMKPVPRTTGTLASDLGVGLLYPTLGDSVQIDVDRVSRMEQREHHLYLKAHGLHATLGQVQGTKVEAGMYQLLVETGTNRVWVDARCVVEHAPAPQQPMMQDESRKSPEVMRKHSNGSYNMT